MTKKERKKMRRQRRLADLQDTQDRIKMGLLPPPPPKGSFSPVSHARGETLTLGFLMQSNSPT